MKEKDKIRTTYPIKKIPYVPNAIANMPFTRVSGKAHG